MARIKISKEESRKELIIRSAATLFRKKGFKAASMRSLAEEVGVEASSLYNHIHSKPIILKEICFQVASQFLNEIQKIEESGASTLENVESLIRFHIRQMIENFEKVYVSDREWRYLQEPFLSQFREQRRLYRKRFAQIIQDGIDRGQITQIDPATAVLIMLHAIGGIEAWHRSKNKISGRELEENMVAILINGLKMKI
ncbi:MAG: TetR family transcriptional regulator [Bacteroidetes bacterium]|nr:TetR family transcriptional regulator [Bacteroidota bacterium]